MNNFVITVFTLALLHVVHGGPTHKRSKREIYPEVEPEKGDDNQPQVCVVGDLVYGPEEPLPADQPCLRCKCRPPAIHCEAISCAKKPGCRAIHKPNTCCPDYQCECEHEGRTYANGERLEQKPGTECKVCYCRGGEVQCAEVSCYIRNDCEGRHVPGKCCPKYDHCPPKDPGIDRSYIAEYSNITRESSAFAENEINETTVSETKTVDKATQTEPEEEPKITIKEIIPEIKEIPITNSPKREVNEPIQGQLLVEEAKDHEREEVKIDNEHDSNELEEIPDAESDSSEVAEIYQQPPPVLRIGDKLLFLKKGELIPEKGASTPETVITIIGAEGLQRGFEDSLENHELLGPKYDSDNLTSDDVEAAESSHVISTVVSPKELLEIIGTTAKSPIVQEISDNIIFKIRNLTDVEGMENIGNFSEVDPFEIKDDIDIAIQLPMSNDTIVPTTIATTSSKVDLITTTKMEKEDSVHDVNPEYPPIPDVMSPQNGEEQEDSSKMEVVDTKILPEILDMRSNKTVPPSGNKSEWLKGVLPESILKEIAASDLETTTDVDLDHTTEPTKLEELKEAKPTESVAHSTTESGESVTDPNEIVNSNEDASVEGLKDFNVADLVELLPGIKMENGSIEIASEIPTQNPNSQDVETLDPNLLRELDNKTHEEDASKQTKTIGKRQNNEDDNIFAELDREIGLISGDITDNKTKEEEQAEAQNIFKELLEESTSNTTPKPIKLEPRDRESAVLQRVSDAIAKFQLRDTKQSLDSNILGILRDFFSSQYRAYNNN